MIMTPNPIPHSKPMLGKEEAERVSEVILSGQIAQGRITREFEEAFAQVLGVKYAAAVSSGTAALHLTLLSMEIGEGDEVVIPSYVCVALLNAIRYVGATPVLAEINPHSGNMDPADVQQRLTSRTRAIIIPHLFGLAAEMDRFLDLKIPIIEDCAQASGADYKGRKVGTFGSAAVFSFYATKVMTTGEGGMVVSNSKSLIERIRDFRDYDHKPDGRTRYNYKMTDLQAAIGLVQLKRLPSFIQKRRVIARQYDQALASLTTILPPQSPDHIYFRYVIQTSEDSEIWQQRMRSCGIVCAKPIDTPIHRILKLTGYPTTEWTWKHSLSIPIYPAISDEEVNAILSALTLFRNA